MESLLTTAAPATEGAPAATGQPSATPPSTPGTPPAASPATPPAEPAATKPAEITYDLKAPEGVDFFDGDVRTSFEATAKKHGLSQVAAQELLSEVTPKLAARRAAQIEDQITSVRQSWYRQSVNHPEWGGSKLAETKDLASKALALGGPELPAFLKETGLDMHPLVIGWARKVGQALHPDRVVTAGGGAPSARKSDAEVLFGKVDRQQ